ncbi:MAG: hypothetical protein R3E31_25760 [Chloroflexota bacterium]
MLHNLSTYTDTLSLTHSSSQNWDVEHLATITISAGEMRIVTVTITIPPDALSGTLDTTISHGKHSLRPFPK